MEENKTEEVQEETEQETEDESQEGFVKKGEEVDVNKHNQVVRKLREAEAKLQELSKEEEAEEEEDDEEEQPDTEKIIDEKLKPVMETLKKREENDRKIARSAFFEAHPEYLEAEKWQELLDELGNSINPNSNDDYYTQLEKTHRIISGDASQAHITDKEKEIAADATTGGGEKGSVKDEFTAEDRRIQKEWKLTDEGLRVYKKKIESGSMRIG